jgi:predicted lipid-binding transport protein (Tim44 family)
MKQFLLSLFVAALGLGFAADPVEAKRLGGGMSQGLKRPTPAQRQADPPPQQQPANAATGAPATAGAAAAAAPRRSWMGPIAGLAAGLGLAALASHLGFGEGLANVMMIALLAMAAIFLVRFLMRRFGPNAGSGSPPQGMRLAAAGAPGAVPQPPRDAAPAAAFSAAGSAGGAAPAQGGAARTLPAGFDAAAFERAAKMIFIRMQAANDSADLNDLRQFSTPEMFAAFRLDLQDRRGTQRTDVVQLQAEVVDVAEEAGQQIVSVRFHGLIREEEDGVAQPFDEIWHLVRPTDGSREWAIAGIAQNEG